MPQPRKVRRRQPVVVTETVIKKTSIVPQRKHRRRPQRPMAAPRPHFGIPTWVGEIHQRHRQMALGRRNSTQRRMHSRMARGEKVAGFTKVVDTESKMRNTKGETVAVRRRIFHKKK